MFILLHWYATYWILILHKSESRIPKATETEIFVSATNDSQPLTVVTKNFVLDAKGVLDQRDRV